MCDIGLNVKGSVHYYYSPCVPNVITLNNYFLIGKILPGRTPYEEATGFDPENFGLMPALQRIEVRVPYYVFDEGLKSYFEHEWDYQCNGNTFKLLLNKGHLHKRYPNFLR